MVDALNDKNGAAIDWWFIYKLPRGLKVPAKPARATSGLEYLHYQPDDPLGFKMSRRRLVWSRSGPAARRWWSVLRRFLL